MTNELSVPVLHCRADVTHTRMGLLLIALAMSTPAHAQVRVDHGRHTRLQRFARDMGYGVAEGLAFAVVDQSRNDPPEWGDGGEGYERRAASNVGEFVVQESVTEGLAAFMKRPLDYQRCRCTSTTPRLVHALRRGLADESPSGAWALAVPRIAGAYSGAWAESSWRPDVENRGREVLVKGTTSLLIGVGINLFHEFIR